jgi:hypothetical protein
MKINEASSREQQQAAPLLGEIRLLQLAFFFIVGLGVHPARRFTW